MALFKEFGILFPFFYSNMLGLDKHYGTKATVSCKKNEAQYTEQGQGRNAKAMRY